MIISHTFCGQLLIRLKPRCPAFLPEDIKHAARDFSLRTVNSLADRAILFDAENTKSADLNLSHTEKRGVTRLCIAENAELKIRKARVTA